MEKINIAEILKDCPKGMELDCTMFDNVTFARVDYSRKQFPIEIVVDGRHSKYLTKEGCYHDNTLLPGAKCVIFPKGKTTWEGFTPPCKFKDGDIVFYNDTIAIFKEWGDETLFRTYVTKYLCCDSLIDMNVPLFGKSVRKEIRLASEYEKEKLFQAIKDNGYKWDAENKTLEKISKPKFKVGNRVQNKNTNTIGTIDLIINDEYEYRVALKNGGITYILFEFQDDWELVKDDIKPKFKVGDRIKTIYKTYHYVIKGITDTHYTLEEVEDKFKYTEPIGNDKNWELVANKFDITTLKPFESMVLVRNSDNGFWQPTFWGIYEAEKANEHHYRNYLTTKGFFRHCIPYNDDTKHLIGKTDDCDEYFKNW